MWRVSLLSRGLRSSSRFCAVSAPRPAFFGGSSSGGGGGARSKALEAAVKQIRHQYGKGAVMQLGEQVALRGELDVISTGSLGLDLALGVGGLPRGRVVEIFGPEASGKTTLALHVIAQAQKKLGADATCAFVDAEHALNPEYAHALGVNKDALWVSQPDSGEQALEVTDTLVRSGAADVVVIDSVAALVPRAELEGEMGDAHMALQARLMSQALRKLTSSISKTNSLVIFINQIRHKVGVMFGSPEVTAGGNALKFYASVRLDIRRTGSIKQGDQLVGNRVKVKVAKNKVAPPFQIAEFDITFGKGISRVGEIVELGVRHGVLEKSGAWYSYGDTQLGQGKEKTKDRLLEDAALAAEIEDKVMAHVLSDDK